MFSDYLNRLNEEIYEKNQEKHKHMYRSWHLIRAYSSFY
jgi:hypothetical protein